MDQINVIVANLGCGGPCGSERIAWARAWTLALVDEPVDLLFFQEAPRDGFHPSFDETFDVFGPHPDAPVFPPRSVVAVRRDAGLDATSFLDVPNADYHGSYLAAARIEHPRIGSVVCVSVHGSPSRLLESDLARWEGPHPEPRVGGGRNANTLWDADYVLDTLARLQAGGYSLLACGDLNEARGWDVEHEGETWGSEYFQLVERKGLVDCLYQHWYEERPTRGDYQIDHTFASPNVASLVASPEVIPTYARVSDPSDHKPITFTLTARKTAAVAVA
jgi:endonuclease/exonuclease/phosphatase family metal-dependent hydrolase